jgi:hypothetical protein
MSPNVTNGVKAGKQLGKIERSDRLKLRVEILLPDLKILRDLIAGTIRSERSCRSNRRPGFSREGARICTTRFAVQRLTLSRLKQVLQGACRANEPVKPYG